MNKTLQKINLSSFPTIIVAVSAMYVIFNLNKLFGSKDERKSDDFIPLDFDPSGLTIEPAHARNYADDLHEAFNYQWVNLAPYDPGTDADKVIEIFSQLRNIDDYGAVFNEFGLRTYSREFGESTIEAFGDRINLKSWLDRECSDATKEIINGLHEWTIDFL